MKQKTKRVTALLLAIAMSLSLLYMSVWAVEEPEEYCGEKSATMESAAEEIKDIDDDPETEVETKVALEGAGEELPEPEPWSDTPEADSEMEADQSSAEDLHSDASGELFSAGEDKTNKSDATEERTPAEARSGDVEKQLHTLSSDNEVKIGRAGQNLFGANRTIYLRLAEYFKQVAAGDRTSTAFEINTEELDLVETSWTAEELGLTTVEKNGVITDQAYEAVRSKFPIQIMRALFYDLPYEFYWSDGNAELSDSSICLRKDGGVPVIYLSDVLVFEFSVLKQYAGSDKFTVKSVGQSVKEAVKNAKDIVAKYAKKTDYEKLNGYRKEICKLVSYSKQDKNGHQLFSVFDDDSSTNVVCEGYARAFKYLCDMTEFSDSSVYCILATGGTNKGDSNHMWNIVHMEDGNYLVDVTNCDEGMIGAPKRLFLVGYDSGDIAKGYSFKCKGEKFIYYYDANTLVGYDADDLTLSKPTIELDKTSLTLNVKKKKNITATVKGPNKEVKWMSSNEKIATVDENGRVTAKKAGKCKIGAKANGVSAVCEVKVRSEKEAAIEEYREFLSQDTINWLDKSDFTNPSNEYSFCLAYLDDDDIPELILTCNIDMHWTDHVSLYAYVNGKVKYVTSEMFLTKNYTKRGVYIDFLEGNGGYWYKNYYLYEKGKVTKWLYYQHTMDWNKQTESNNYYKYKSKKKVKIKKREFNKLLKKKVGGAKASQFSMHKNTKRNRKKYLK